MADGENRFVQIESILQEQFIRCRSAGISRAAFRNPAFTITFRVDVIFAAWQKHALRSGENAGDPILVLMQRNDHRDGAGGL